MILKSKRSLLRELEALPGMGERFANILWSIGIRSIQDLQDRDADEIFGRLSLRQGGDMDRTVLYVLRCAVYFASRQAHDPELLKWWNWQDREPVPEQEAQRRPM